MKNINIDFSFFTKSFSTKILDMAHVAMVKILFEHF